MESRGVSPVPPWLPAIAIIEVSISQPNRHRFCLPLLWYIWSLRHLNLKVLKKDLVNLLFIISDTHKLLTSCSSFTWHHRSSATAHLLSARSPPPTGPVLVRDPKHSLYPQSSRAAYLFWNPIWVGASAFKIYFVPVCDDFTDIPLLNIPYPQHPPCISLLKSKAN